MGEYSKCPVRDKTNTEESPYIVAVNLNKLNSSIIDSSLTI